MIGEYTFKINGLDCEPSYSDDLKKQYELNQNEAFYKVSLVGELTFSKSDFDYIIAQPFDTIFNIDIYKNSILYFSGKFLRPDCKENFDDKVIKVSLSPIDAYDKILNEYDKEYNIIDLKPKLENILIDKRPLLQVYNAGSTIVNSFLNGTMREQEVTPTESASDLHTKYFFNNAATVMEVQVTAQNGASSSYNGTYAGNILTITNEPGVFYRAILHKNNSTDYIKAEEYTDGYNRNWYYVMFRNGIATYILSPATSPLADPVQNLNPESGQTGILLTNTHTTTIWLRYLTAVKSVGSLVANDLQNDDLVANNYNYKYALPYAADIILIVANTSTEPTEYGKNMEGLYFAPPSIAYGTKYYPVAKDKWVNASIWLAFHLIDNTFEQQWRNQYVFRDAYDLASVIDLLLKQINSNYYFTESNSQFLYGDLSIRTDSAKLFITQKSNILKSTYDKSAQKAITSLKQILDMLFGVYECKWHMAGDALYIEHISYYNQGYSYLDTNQVILDLTDLTHVRHYLPYTFQKNNYSYDKVELAKSIQYKYTDEVSDTFNGMPIEVLSNFAQDGKVEEINISNFNPDIDLMLLLSTNMNQDGFALLGAILQSSTDLIDRTSSDYKVGYGLTLEGNLYAQTGLLTSNYIPVQPYQFYSANHDGYIGCWYDINKQFISDFYQMTLGVQPPVNAYYARVCWVYSDDDFKFVRGLITDNYTLPYVSNNINGVAYNTQNGYLSFTWLIPNYHVYNLPADNVKINGQVFTGSIKTKRIKKQEIWFSGEDDLIPTKLVKTNAGNGKIEKMIINITSRRVDLSLKHDTY